MGNPFSIYERKREKMIRQTNKSNVFLVEAKSLDILCMGGFEKDLENTLQSGFGDLYLDFSLVEDVSSAVLGILLHKKMKMRKLGREIFITNISPSIQRILKILNLTSLLLQSRNHLAIQLFDRNAANSMYASAVPAG